MAWEFGAAVVGMFNLSVAVRMLIVTRWLLISLLGLSEREASTFRLNTKKKLLYFSKIPFLFSYSQW